MSTPQTRRCLVARGAWLLAAALAVWGCRAGQGEERTEVQREADMEAARHRMVRDQIAARGVRDERVLAAMRDVPRHLFVPEEWRDDAYVDGPLPIGYDQTISQPFIVALMTALADVGPGDKVLEIGTGSGYQAAVLGKVAGEVWSIEIVRPLADRARETLKELGFENVHVRHGDGYAGWPEAGPFDAIVVTAAPPRIPAPLVLQLVQGGRMVVPVGDGVQDLRVVERRGDGVIERSVIPVRFVPMTGAVRGEAPPTEEDPSQGNRN